MNDTIGLGSVFLSELIGTGLLTLLGGGVVATAILNKSKGLGGGWLLINVGWGIAVFAGAAAAINSGGHLNPAVTISRLVDGSTEFAPGVPIGAGAFFVYLAGQFVGAFAGAVLVWAAFRDHFNAEGDPANQLGVFSTGPQIRSYGSNLVTEAIATFVLVLGINAIGANAAGSGAWAVALGPFAVAVLVVGIGASLGGPTGYAINPARDLGPRIAHALLPMTGKGSSDWGYAWVPVVGPIVGGVVAGLVSRGIF